MGTVQELFHALAAAVAEGKSVDVLTLIAAPDDCIGQMVLLYGDGRMEGLLKNPEFTRQVMNKIQSRQWKGPVDLEIDDKGIHRVFWDRVSRLRAAIVLGGGHISQPLVSILSKMEFAVTVVDDRPEFANRERFPGAASVICEPFAAALQNLDFNRDTAVIIVTRGHRYDLECLRAVAGKAMRYIGMIGSRRRVAAVRELLQSEPGIGKDVLQKIHAPIGLDIGAETPAEIAVSIAAEIVAVFRGGSCSPLSVKGGGCQ